MEHILRFSGNRGLGHAFAAGIDRCLLLGADIIVNTDGDNQYSGACIPDLIRPILEGRADIVIGDRQPEKVAQFSWLKTKLQIIGSRFVSQLAGISVPDVASGFRAYSREAAMRLVCSTDFDHTVDHVIQAGHRRIITASVPIATNDKLRESRLFGSVTEFILRSVGVMVRVYSSYQALRIFSRLGLITIGAGVLLGVRFLYFFFFVAGDPRLARSVAHSGGDSRARRRANAPDRHRCRSHQFDPISARGRLLPQSKDRIESETGRPLRPPCKPRAAMPLKPTTSCEIIEG